MAFYSNDTAVANYGSIQVIDKVKGYVIRDEKIIKANYEGTIKYYAEDGQKVEKGFKVLEIQKNVVDEDTRKKLELINERISNLKNEEFFKTDIEKINKDIDNIVCEMQKASKDNEIKKVLNLKKELQVKVDKKSMISGDQSFYNKNIDTLKKEQEQLQTKINNDIQAYKSSESGLISYYIDGLENIFTLKNMATIDLDTFELKKYERNNLKESQNAIVKQPLYKIVNNTTWYLVSQIDKKYIDNYKEGRKISIEIGEKKLGAMIYKIIKGQEKSLVIVKINEFFQDFHKMRQIDANVFVVDYEGLKLPKDVLTKQDDKLGVYVLDVNKYTVFKEVSVLGYDDENVIIKSNVFYKKIDGELKSVRTVKLYDEVVRNGDKIKEGQIIY